MTHTQTHRYTHIDALLEGGGGSFEMRTRVRVFFRHAPRKVVLFSHPRGVLANHWCAPLVEGPRLHNYSLTGVMIRIVIDRADDGEDHDDDEHKQQHQAAPLPLLGTSRQFPFPSRKQRRQHTQSSSQLRKGHIGVECGQSREDKRGRGGRKIVPQLKLC